MRKIDYDKRSEWGEFVSEDTLFIQNIIKKLNARTVLEVPCSNGRNLNVICDIVDYAIFGDINKQMVDIVQNKINMEQKNNCSAMVLDFCDLSVLPAYANVDLILITQQSFQLLNREQAQKALLNMRKSGAKYIVIDIYDFLSQAADLPIYLVNDTFFVDANATNWVRKSTLIPGEGGFIYLRHDYFAEDASYTTTLTLENYSRKEIISLCKQCGFVIGDTFTTYNMSFNDKQGRTIVLLINK